MRVSRTSFTLPRRVATGVDFNRVNMLAAVLEKRCRYDLSQCDLYVNIAGGLRMNEPAMDLAVALALISSHKDLPVSAKTAAFGEVGLSGEVRAVTMAEQRVREAKKLGFTRCILPKACAAKLPVIEGIEVCGVSNVQEAVAFIREGR